MQASLASLWPAIPPPCILIGRDGFHIPPAAAQLLSQKDPTEMNPKTDKRLLSRLVVFHVG